MTIPEIFQFVGGILLTLAALPQITQVIITKNVRGLNLTTFTMILIGNVFKSVYGIYMAINGYGIILIITTSMSFTIILILIILIIYYRFFVEEVN